MYSCATGQSEAFSFLPGLGRELMVSVVHGTTNSPLGVAYKTTKDMQVLDIFGNEVQAETFAYDGNTFERFKWVVKEYDAHARLTAIFDNNGMRTACLNGIAGVTNEIDSVGQRTMYTYDSIGRRIRSESVEIPGFLPALIKVLAYDAKGNVVSQTE